MKRRDYGRGQLIQSGPDKTWKVRAILFDAKTHKIRRMTRDTSQTNRRAAQAQADQWIADTRLKRAELRNEILGPVEDEPDIRWSEMVRIYVERKVSQGRSARINGRPHFEEYFCDTLQDPMWSQVRKPAIDRYVRLRLDAGAAKATIRNELRIIDAIQKHARNANRLDDKFLKKWSVRYYLDVIEENPYRGWDPEEYEVFKKALPDHCRFIVEFAWQTGFRRAQIETLDWGTHLNLARGTLRPVRQKKGRQIEFPFSVIPSLATLIEEIREWTVEEQHYPTDSGPVFRRPKVEHGDRRRGADDRIKDWRPEWNRAMAEAKKEMPTFGEDRPGFKPGLHFHGFRRSVVSQHLGLGTQRELIAQLTGHKTLSMIDFYNTALPEHFRDAMAKRDEAETARKAKLNGTLGTPELSIDNSDSDLCDLSPKNGRSHISL